MLLSSETDHDLLLPLQKMLHELDLYNKITPFMLSFSDMLIRDVMTFIIQMVCHNTCTIRILLTRRLGECQCDAHNCANDHIKEDLRQCNVCGLVYIDTHHKRAHTDCNKCHESSRWNETIKNTNFIRPRRQVD